MKKIKGYAAIDFFKKGWRGNDSAIFVYRRKSKGEEWMIPVTIEVKKRSPSKNKE